MAAAAEFEVTARRTYETGFAIVCSVASIAHTVGVGIRLIETVPTISRHESRRDDRGVQGSKLPWRLRVRLGALLCLVFQEPHRVRLLYRRHLSVHFLASLELD